MSRTRRGCRTASVLLGTAVAAALPATAEAHHVKSVAITGPPLVGATLTATVVFNEVAPVEYRWQRCSGPLQRDCDRIQAAADAPTYTLVPADRGAFIAVRVLAAADADTESRWSDLTTVVTDPPAPTPTPSPTPVPTPVAHTRADAGARARAGSGSAVPSRVRHRRRSAPASRSPARPRCRR